MMDSLVFFIPVIAITVKSVSEEIIECLACILRNTRKAWIKLSHGLWALCSLRLPSFVLKNDDFQVRQWTFYDNKNKFDASNAFF